MNFHHEDDGSAEEIEAELVPVPCQGCVHWSVWSVQITSTK